MHSPEHTAPDCSCPCPDCEARAAHHPHDHPQAIADERDPVTPALAGELVTTGAGWRPHGTRAEEEAGRIQRWALEELAEEDRATEAELRMLWGDR